MFTRYKHFPAVIAFVLALVLAFVPTLETLAQDNGTKVERLSGDNRFETAVEISKQGWPDGSETVIIATGRDFPDALAGAPLAHLHQAPILLTEKNKLSDVTRDEIIRLGAKKAIILGGTAAVSDAVEKAIEKLNVKVERISGQNRYETAAKIASQLGNFDTAFVVDGTNFPDALAVGPYAAQKRIPILLTKKNVLPDETRGSLKSVKKTYVIGGPAAVYDNVFKSLPNAERIYGQNRYATAVEIAQTFKLDISYSVIATGEDFADALTGAALAAKQNAPILLVQKSKIPDALAPKISNIKTAIVLGGTAAISQDVFNQIRTGVVTTPEGDLLVHYIDVGQGDATLLQGPDFTVLIDAGRHDRNDVVPYLKSMNVKSIDLLILTHPHADHIGQAVNVLKSFKVDEVWMSGSEHTSITYEELIDTLLESDVNYNEPRAGERYKIGSLDIEVLHPDRLIGDFNEDSIAIRAIYGNVKFVFTGDAEKRGEETMVKSGRDLRADILHLGHHGSNTSSTEAFLKAVDPDVAIYSAGKDNPYGHPHQEVIQRLFDLKIKVYGTDVHGTIIVKTDGKTYDISTEKSGKIQIPGQDDENEDSDAPPGCININTASFEELQLIVHIGPERAQQIIELRPFSSLDDLLRVDGIGPSRLQDIKEQGLACVK